MYFDTILEQEGYLLGKTYNEMLLYYRDISAIQSLKNIETPVLCINSIDDPIIPIYLDKYKDMCDLCKNMIFILTSSGSHCSWVDIFGNFMPNDYITNFFELS